MQRCLIIGYGRMGRVHARHLDELGCDWDYHDTFVEGGVQLESRNYSHVIISTPIGTHHSVYEKLKDFTGSILIEKPVIVEKEHLFVLNDERVFPGMVERFNPASQFLLNRNLTSLDFTRNASDLPPICDIAIHDIDLAFFAIGDCGGWAIESVTGDKIEGQIGDVHVTFSFKKLSRKKRKCLVNGSDVIDFYHQSYNGERLSFQWPIKVELECFLSGCWPDRRLAYLSHEYMTQAMSNAPSCKT